MVNESQELLSEIVLSREKAVEKVGSQPRMSQPPVDDCEVQLDLVQELAGQLRLLEDRFRFLPRQVQLARITERDRKVVSGRRHADVPLRARLLLQRSLHGLAEDERSLREAPLPLDLDPQRPQLVEAL